MATVLTGLAGLIAVVAWRRLVRYPRELSLPRSLRIGVLVTAVVAAAAMGYASLLGGYILHDAPGLASPGPAQRVVPPAR